MSESGSCASSDCSEAHQETNRQRDRPRHSWVSMGESDLEIHLVNFGFAHSFLLNDRGNLAGFEGITPQQIGFSNFERDSSVCGTQSEYEETNQVIRERVWTQGWS
jgi:hypothetical protein